MAQASWVWQAEREVLQGWLPDLFGYHILQLGGGEDLLGASRIPHRLILGVHLLGRPEALPLAGDSVDVAVLPHTLEASPAPYRVLEEVQRILVPGGHLFVFGFHPLSPSNLYHRRGIPPGRVRTWCRQAGLEVLARVSLGTRTWCFPRSLYLLRAQKRVAAVTPIRPPWQLRTRLVPKAVNG